MHVFLKVKGQKYMQIITKRQRYCYNSNIILLKKIKFCKSLRVFVETAYTKRGVKVLVIGIWKYSKQKTQGKCDQKIND